jgi:cellulose synthase operon protein YhjQ
MGFAAPVENRRPAPTSAPDGRGARWNALRSVLQGGQTEASGGEGRTAVKALPGGSLTIISSGGGVGVSTIAATLGRIFTSRKERVLLLDGAPNSVLPFYFGASSPMSGSCVFRERQNASDQSIRLVSRAYSGSPDHNAGVEPDESLWSTVEYHLADVDRLLIDSWAGMKAEIREKLLLESSCLVVLVPDLRSTVRIRGLLDFFREHEKESGRSITPHFLINQYDATVPLHQDLQRSLSMQLGDRLLPFTLRRTDEVAFALAEGTTIVDYAPDSGIAGDFVRLAEWLEMGQGSASEWRKLRAFAGAAR